MERLAFTMRLKPGVTAEYEKRHDAIWPDLQELLKQTGISDYSIFLDRDGVTLFAVLTVRDRVALDALPQHAVMRRWWTFMADIMDTNPDDSPVVLPLRQVFFLK